MLVENVDVIESPITPETSNDSSFSITEIDTKKRTVTVVLRQEQIGPIADTLKSNKVCGRANTRFQLGSKLNVAKSIMTGRVDPEQVNFTGTII